jgi:hypothetical protein
MRFSLIGFELFFNEDYIKEDFGFWIFSFKINDNYPRALIGFHYDDENGYIGQLLFTNWSLF